MENKNGAALRDSHRAVFDVLRPIVRVLRASGFDESAIRSAIERACRLYANSPARGVWLDRTRYAELAEVLVAWTRDPDFTDETGLPRKLSLDSKPSSFRALLRRAGCAIPPHVALAQLLELGSIQPCDRGHRVRLVSNVVIPVMGRRFLAPPMLDSIRRFSETLEYNLCEGPRPGEGRMHRWATCVTLDPAQFDEAQRFVRSNGQTFLEAMDEKLASCAQRGTRRRGLTYGVGLYVFVDQPKVTLRRRTRRRRR